MIEFGIKIASEKDCTSLSKFLEDPSGLSTLYSDSFNGIYMDRHQN